MTGTLRLTAPSESAIRACLEANRDAPYTYPMPGVTELPGSICERVPDTFDVDYTQASLGHGHETYQAACQAIRDWQMFAASWIQTCYPEVPIEKDAVVGILAKTAGIWSLNISRLVYVVEEPRRFGFAYGTLPHHVESGEERFVVWHDLSDDTVWYSITAVSSPCHWMVRLGKPFARHVQRIFAQESVAAMRRAIKKTTG